MATLQVRLLGELGAESDGTAVTLPASRRACALLACIRVLVPRLPTGDQ